jgi:hypothetical protein
MAETIVLDPSGIAVSRTQLDITSWVAADGVDWGDAAIEAYMATGSAYSGSNPVDFRVPNRTVTIPLRLRAVGAVTFDTIRTQIQQKVALFHREQGWIGRNVKGTQLYADVVNASLHLGGSYLQAYKDVDIDATLVLECVPDFYGNEVDLGTFTESVKPALDFMAGTAIAGNYPGRTRAVVTNSGTVDWHGLEWGVRSRYYDPAVTAALMYEAEAMTPLDAAAASSLSFGSGGSAILHNNLPANAWCPVLTTDLLGGTALTHKGTYRVGARVYSPVTPQLRLAWGVGDVTHPTTNDPVTIPGAGQLYFVDLGAIRVESTPSGATPWKGVLQAQAAHQGDSLYVDALFFQPLDEFAGRCIAVQTPSILGINVTNQPGSGVNMTGVGSGAWNNPAYIVAADGVGATPSTTGVTNYLVSKSHNFVIPTGATISGIQVNILRRANAPTGPYTGRPTDNQVRLVKNVSSVATVQATDRADTATSWPDNWAVKSYGGPTDLWGGSWAPADINDPLFGAALSISQPGVAPVPAAVDQITITIYYTTSGGFTTTPDAVVYAGKQAELRTEGTFRQNVTGTVWSRIAQTLGDLPRIPPSGLEGRSVEFFLKPSRGDLQTEADPVIDSISTHLYYRPSYLTTP